MIVTTCVRHTPSILERAALISERTGAPLVPRRGSLLSVLTAHQDTLAYVVGRFAESLVTETEKLSVDVGLLHAKVHAGMAHPLMRAIGPATSVLDGTLGLAGDALHLAAVLKVEVCAAEISPVVFCLAEAGLKRLQTDRKWSAAASRVRPHPCSALELLSNSPPVDAVLLAPMFSTPAAAAPGYALFRSASDMRALDPHTYKVAQAKSRRVVVRVERGRGAPFDGMTLLPGKAVDYWVWTATESVG